MHLPATLNSLLAGNLYFPIVQKERPPLQAASANKWGGFKEQGYIAAKFFPEHSSDVDTFE